MRFICNVCGRISDERYCEAHRSPPSKGWSGTKRDRNAQKRFRAAIMERDRACVICGSTQDLRACHHPRPLRDYSVGDPMAYDPANGVLLCGRCDRERDPFSR